MVVLIERIYVFTKRMLKSAEAANATSVSRRFELETRASARGQNGLEIKLQCKLNDSRVSNSRGNNSETATTPSREERSGIREVGMVEGIKELGAEFESHDFPHRENLEHTDVRIRESGAVISADAAIPELAEPWKGERSGVQPQPGSGIIRSSSSAVPDAIRA